MAVLPIPSEPRERTKELMEARRIIQGQFTIARGALAAMQMAGISFHINEKVTDSGELRSSTLTINIEDVDGKPWTMTCDLDITRTVIEE